jgi:catechol 2,3-dioxygenase-like lactoylglutathione lyase family enzyme
MAKLQSVAPISNEDVGALPVKELSSATTFYEEVLGFTVIHRDSASVRLSRDEVEISLVPQADHKPGEAGSLAFKVDDLEAMHRELEGKNCERGVFGTDEWGGKKFRTFFVREHENGYCYCFYQPL